VGKALELKNGAVTKRWSRLKQAMNEGKTPGPSAYEFLWLLVKHSARDKVCSHPSTSYFTFSVLLPFRLCHFNPRTTVRVNNP
jgi:hypothetical protein